MTYLSVIIPAYNEADRLGLTLEKVAVYLDSQPYEKEVLVINDGSRDQTAQVVQDFSQHHPYFRLIDNTVNRGKGAVVRQGMLAACGQYVLFSDADLSAPIEEVERLLPHLEQGYDGAIGSRNKPAEGVHVEALLKRKILGRVFNSIVQLLVLPEYEDTQCGFKAFRHDAAQAIFSRQKFEGFSFDVEILYIAKCLRLKCLEVGVNWAHVPASRVSLIKDSWRMFKDIVQIRRIHHQTRAEAKKTASTVSQ